MQKTDLAQRQGQKTQGRMTGPGRWYALGVLTFVWALSFLDRNVLSIVLDPVKKEFHLSDTMLGAMVGIGFALIYLILSMPVSRLADRKPRVPIIAVGLALWSIMTTMSGIARSAFQLLIYRMGVGVGESTSTAPGISLIGDYFTKDERPLATSIYGLAPSLGLYFGFLIGGLATYYYGWRMAFFFAGIPGLLVAIVMYFTVKEPPRGLSDGAGVDTAFYSLGDSFRYFLSNKTYVLIIAADCLTAFASFACFTWNPSFFRRVHHLNMAQIGLVVGSVMGASGILGGLLSGFITSKISRGRDRLKAVVPAIMLILTAPAMIMQCLPESLTFSLIFLFIAQLLLAPCNGLELALVQTIVKVRMRAFAASLFFVFANLFGMTLAPLTIGILNDALTSRFGNMAVRYSLLTTVPASVIAGLFLIWATRHLKGDIAKALEKDAR